MAEYDISDQFEEMVATIGGYMPADISIHIAIKNGEAVVSAQNLSNNVLYEFLVSDVVTSED